MALRLIPSPPAISRELWICSPKGAWRFFRIGDDSVTELGIDGEPLTTRVAGTVVVPGKVSGTLTRIPVPGEVSVERMVSISENLPISDIKGV
jgi:hypothetical protein